MTPDEIQIFFKENEPPFILETKGGRSYRITDRTSVWIPAAYPKMLCVAIVEKGIMVLKISAIESIHIEHEAASR